MIRQVLAFCWASSSRSYGGIVDSCTVMTRELFGASAMGSNYGAIFLLSCVGMGLGAWLGGRLFDGTGSYQIMYVVSALLSIAGAAVAIWLPPRLTPPATVSVHQATGTS